MENVAAFGKGSFKLLNGTEVVGMDQLEFKLENQDSMVATLQ